AGHLLKLAPVLAAGPGARNPRRRRCRATHPGPDRHRRDQSPQVQRSLTQRTLMAGRDAHGGYAATRFVKSISLDRLAPDAAPAASLFDPSETTVSPESPILRRVGSVGHGYLLRFPRSTRRVAGAADPLPARSTPLLTRRPRSVRHSIHPAR